jgi:hypothetical protein
MRIQRAIAVLAAAAVAAFIVPAPAAAQLVLGQYEEEAPVRSWNSFALATAAALGRGETSFTLGRDASAAMANPALLSDLPPFTLASNAYLQSTGFSKYGPVNTGVILTQGNVNLVAAGFDSSGLSVRLGGWTLALNVFSEELYGRPAVSVQATYNGTVYHEADTSQSGILRTWQFAVSRRIGSGLSLGAAFNAVQGSLERKFIDTGYFPNVVITDRKEQTFSGFYVNGGILARISEKLRAALVFRTPYRKEISSQSNLTYEAPAAGTVITISDEAEDTAEIPASIGLGLRLSVLAGLDVFAEATATFWSRYKVSFFGDAQTRDFADVIKAGLGLEYRVPVRLFGDSAVVPLRIGGIYDPQPPKTPRSAYAGITLGTGLQGKRVGLDIGGLIGRESGSGADLGIAKLALSLRFVL